VDDTDCALFAAATWVTMNNGRTAKFWTSSWLDGMSPAAMFPALFQKSKRKNWSVAEALDNDNWIMDIMQDISPALLIDYIMLWTLVDAAGLDLSRQEEDSIVDQNGKWHVVSWTLDHGCYTRCSFLAV
jgi:hypothetical protein